MIRALIVMALTAVPVLAAQQLQPGDVAVLPLPDSHAVRFTLRTMAGHASFDAGADWGVIAMQSRPPVTVTAFQIPDAADQGTPDSTNLAITLVQPASDDGKRILAHNADEDRDAAASQYKTWTLHARDGVQGATHYAIVDAEGPAADAICAVRFAWPRLARHGAGYDAKMDALFKTFLDSVGGGTDTYALHPSEIVRRPAIQ